MVSYALKEWNDIRLAYNIRLAYKFLPWSDSPSSHQYCWEDKLLQEHCSRQFAPQPGQARRNVKLHKPQGPSLKE